MDLLASLNISTLPEQQTRTSHPDLSAALATLPPAARLGFTHCIVCAKTPAPVSCPKCRRVKYCSHTCRKRDKDWASNDENEDDTAMGHSRIVCALLKLCDEDETTQYALEKTMKTPGGGSNNGGDNVSEEAEERIRSELESYPATLANAMADGGPSSCYRRILRSRRGGAVGGGRVEKTTLTVHIIGATTTAELWRGVGTFDAAVAAYAEAFNDLAESNGIAVINLVFVGNDNDDESDDDDDDGVTKNKLSSPWRRRSTTSWTGPKMTHRVDVSFAQCDYDEVFLGEAPPPDVCAFFNPGLTCGDYAWDAALDCIPSGTPFLVTSNTEMEAVMDCQYLFEGGYIPTLPRVVREMVRIEEEGVRRDDNDDDDETMEEENGMFFCDNPFCGSRVRQSGNMANDVFVKSRFMFGGVWGGTMKNDEGTVRKRSSCGHSRTEEEDIATQQQHKTKKIKSHGKGNKLSNTKKNNPALI